MKISQITVDQLLSSITIARKIAIRHVINLNSKENSQYEKQNFITWALTSDPKVQSLQDGTSHDTGKNASQANQNNGFHI